MSTMIEVPETIVKPGNITIIAFDHDTQHTRLVSIDKAYGLVGAMTAAETAIKDLGVFHKPNKRDVTLFPELHEGCTINHATLMCVDHDSGAPLT